MAASAAAKRALIADLPLPCEEHLVTRLTGLLNGIAAKAEELKQAVQELDNVGAPLDQARFCRESILQRMKELRALADEAEVIVDEKAWPFPGYGELLTTK